MAKLCMAHASRLGQNEHITCKTSALIYQGVFFWFWDNKNYYANQGSVSLLEIVMFEYSSPPPIFNALSLIFNALQLKPSSRKDQLFFALVQFQTIRK